MLPFIASQIKSMDKVVAKWRKKHAKELAKAGVLESSAAAGAAPLSSPAPAAAAAGRASSASSAPAPAPTAAIATGGGAATAAAAAVGAGQRVRGKPQTGPRVTRAAMRRLLKKIRDIDRYGTFDVPILKEMFPTPAHADEYFQVCWSGSGSMNLLLLVG